jgi:hypothetical protein
MRAKPTNNTPKYLVDEIKMKAVNLIKKNWRIEFKWVKAHVGMYGNEIADRLAKEATKNQHETYSRLPKCAIIRENRQQSIRKWQSQWEETTKGAVTKEFFPSVEGRLAIDLNLNPNITAIMTGHGNIRSYLHRLKIIGCPECPCTDGRPSNIQVRKASERKSTSKEQCIKSGQMASEQK